MTAADFPEGFQVLIHRPEHAITLERIDADHWEEASYHCVDCVETLTDAEVNALLTAHGWEVASVPTAWLREEFERMVVMEDTDRDRLIASMVEMLGHGA